MTASPLRALAGTSVANRSVGYRPWFQRRPALTAAVSASLFAVVATARFAMGDDAAVGVSMLYALPVSLVGMAWGRLAGVSAGIGALLLVALWVLVADIDLSWVGWSSRAVPLVLIGFLLGDASERLERAEYERVQARARDLRHRQAVEINDSLIQGMAGAKWSLEAGQHAAGLTILEETIERGQSLVSELIRNADGADARRPS